ncbi:MAG: acyl-ACP--UDP-N-acetylglucosamine O-acyltransferase, partial [Betaproteobacteria bacterium]|nr:acyl-ACP--UDP-N-acetylglucosamine O-acyltransferase [Betaproteobacteria bacterium]
MAKIAPGAQVSESARLAEDVAVGAGAVIEENCEIGAGSSIGAYSIIWRGTQIGRGNRIFPFCSLGGEPQDKKFRGEESALIIGDRNVIREYCFFNRGTAEGGGETRIGNDNWIMAYVHVAHDCRLEDGVVAVNGAQFAGHVAIGGGAVIGGGALFHQFRRVGAGAMVGGGERVRQDVPPFALAARGVVGVNAEGMRRAGFNKTAVARMKEAYRFLYHSDLPLAAARQKIG